MHIDNANPLQPGLSFDARSTSDLGSREGAPVGVSFRRVGLVAVTSSAPWIKFQDGSNAERQRLCVLVRVIDFHDRLTSVFQRVRLVSVIYRRSSAHSTDPTLHCGGDAAQMG